MTRPHVCALLVLGSCSNTFNLRHVSEGEFSVLGAGGGQDDGLQPLRRDCSARINSTADRAKKLGDKSHTWSVALGLLGGTGAGYGIIAATDTGTFGKSPTYVAAGVAAASAILAPFVTSKEAASKTGAEYSTLRGEFEKAMRSRALGERYDLLQQCAYGHVEFTVGPFRTPTDLPPYPQDEKKAEGK
jgi:hypothetical protein